MSCRCETDGPAAGNAHSAASRASPFPMHSVQDAMKILCQTLESLTIYQKKEWISTVHADGRVVAEDVCAKDDFPRFPTSIMDGYAVRSEDLRSTSNGNVNMDVELQVVANITAGADTSSIHLQSGQCAYITTGACVPKGADAVVMIEETEVVIDSNYPAADAKNTTGTTAGSRIRIMRPVSSGENVRTIGSDVHAQECLLNEGDVIHSAEIGLLLSMRITCVPVYAIPSVAIVSSGDELLDLTTNQANDLQSTDSDANANANSTCIVDSNRPMLISLFGSVKCTVYDLGILRDTTEDINNCLHRCMREFDILVCIGGVSMGELDLLKGALSQHGTIHIGRIAMKPGKPMTFATIPRPSQPDTGLTTSGKTDPLLIFGLPGNPVSAFVTSHLFVLPSIRYLHGEIASIETHGYPQVTVEIMNEIALDPRPEYHRAIVIFDEERQKLIAFSTGMQRSSRLLSLRSSNALIVLPSSSSSGAKTLNSKTALPALLIGPLLPTSRRTITKLIENSSSVKSSSSQSHTHSHSHFPHQHHQSSDSSSLVSHPHHSVDAKTFKVCILTVSDRASSGVYEDVSGPTIARMLQNASSTVTYDICDRKVVPDTIRAVTSTLNTWIDPENQMPLPFGQRIVRLFPRLIITTGGTGFSPRDITPDAVSPMLTRAAATGITHLLLSTSAAKTPFYCLSRPVAGIIKDCLVITLPGSKKAVEECMEALLPILPHALSQLG